MLRTKTEWCCTDNNEVVYEGRLPVFVDVLLKKKNNEKGHHHIRILSVVGWLARISLENLHPLPIDIIKHFK